MPVSRSLVIRGKSFVATRAFNSPFQPACVAFVLAILGTGCAGLKAPPPASDVRFTPDFTSASLRAGGLAVAGVIGITSEGGDSSKVRAARAEAAARLWGRLQDAREGWRVVKEEDLTAALGRQEHEMLLAAYARTRPLASEELAGHASHVQEGPRYLLFGAVELDTIRQTVRDFVKLGDLDLDCPCCSKPNAYYSIYETSRTVVATFDVYDRMSHRFAWHGSIEETNSETKCEEPPGLLKDIVRTVFDLSPYPDPPVRIGVLEGIFKKLTRALPEAD